MVIIMIMSSLGLFNDDFHDYLDEFGDDSDEIAVSAKKDFFEETIENCNQSPKELIPQWVKFY